MNKLSGKEKAPRIGRVIIPQDVNVWPHELSTARVLASDGRCVEFLPRIDGNRARSADILMGGVVWEMKSPETGRLSSLQRVLRRASKQSSNIIIDDARMRGVSDAAVEKELRRLKPLVKAIRRLVFVSKGRDVVDIR